MADKRLNIKVRTEGAKRTKQELKGVEGGLAGLGKATAKVGAVFFAAKGLISGMSKVIELSAQQELAEKKLSTALGRTSQGLLDQASALQQVSTFGDEAIITQQAFLASLEFSEKQIKEIIDASINLSAATGISLESAVRNTAKTFSGLSGELGELIPQLRDLTAEEMKAGDAVKLLSDLFKGQATAQTKTLSGSIEQMKNAIGDAGEAMGDLFAPVVITVAKKLKSAAEFTSEFLTGLKNIAEFGDAGGIEAVKEQSDRTVLGYQNLSLALSHYRSEAIRLGLDLNKLTKESLFNDQNVMASKREQVEFFKSKVEEEISHRVEKETEKNKELTNLRLQHQAQEAEILGDIALTPEELEFAKNQASEIVEISARDVAIREKASMFAAQTAASMMTSAIMGDNVGESLKRAVIQLGLMVAQAKIYNAVMNMSSLGGGGIFGSAVKFLFGASPTQTASSSNVTINQSFGGMGVIDQNFATNQIIPAINKAISTGQARIAR